MPHNKTYYNKGQTVPLDNIPTNDFNIECISCHSIAIKNKKALYPILIDNSQFVWCKTCVMTNDYIERDEFKVICPI